MKLSVDSLTTGLQFHGEVQGKRQHYYVLSSARQYFVMSLSLASATPATSIWSAARPSISSIAGCAGGAG
jgi:hypothetical protein